VFENAIENGINETKMAAAASENQYTVITTVFMRTDFAQIFTIAPYQLAVYENAIENGKGETESQE
jgi:hypothetical protein